MIVRIAVAKLSEDCEVFEREIAKRHKKPDLSNLSAQERQLKLKEYKENKKQFARNEVALWIYTVNRLNRETELEKTHEQHSN
ncbi:MAG: hypothetical protein HRT45_08445 [Bdellovibrionales bacterium]|nr:hypothetical protein [Bdellovibrionales bacterium]